VLRRSEGDTLFVPERRRSRRLPGAIRARDVRAADLQEEPTKGVSKRAASSTHCFVGSDEDGGFTANTQRAERAIRDSEHRERSNQI
jgi:hypothetical protein